jgi:hypothetical protein
VTSVSQAAGLMDDGSGVMMDDICAGFLYISVTKRKVENREESYNVLKTMQE